MARKNAKIAPKPVQKRSRLPLIGIGLALVAVVIMVGRTSATHGRATHGSKPAAQFTPSGRFWYLGNESRAEAQTKAREFAERTRILLRAHADDSPLTQEIWQTFGEHFRVARVQRHMIEPLWHDSRTGYAVTFGLIAEMDAAAYSATALEDHSTGVAASYSDKYNIVLLPAETLPDAWTVSLLYHELGHALRCRQHGSGDRPREEIHREEVEMHELQNVVLASASGGQTTAFQSFLLGGLSEMAPIDFRICKTLPMPFYQMYAGLLGFDPNDAQIRREVFGQLCYTLGFQALERAGQGTPAAKAAFYRNVTGRPL